MRKSFLILFLGQKQLQCQSVSVFVGIELFVYCTHITRRKWYAPHPSENGQMKEQCANHPHTNTNANACVTTISRWDEKCSLLQSSVFPFGADTMSHHCHCESKTNLHVVSPKAAVHSDDTRRQSAIFFSLIFELISIVTSRCKSRTEIAHEKLLLYTIFTGNVMPCHMSVFDFVCGLSPHSRLWILQNNSMWSSHEMIHSKYKNCMSWRRVERKCRRTFEQILFCAHNKIYARRFSWIYLFFT